MFAHVFPLNLDPGPLPPASIVALLESTEKLRRLVAIGERLLKDTAEAQLNDDRIFRRASETEEWLTILQRWSEVYYEFAVQTAWSSPYTR